MRISGCLLSFLLLLCCCNSCESKPYRVKRIGIIKPASAARKIADADYYTKLNSYQDLLDLQGEPLSAKFNAVQSVKVVYELRHGRIYFVNSPKFRYHYDFCTRGLGYSAPLEVFNADNYGNSIQREYLLANLNYYTQSGIYALEFVSEDKINAGQLATFYDAVKKASYIGDSLKLLAGTNFLLALDAAGKLQMPRVYASDIYTGQHYQPLNAGASVGILRLVADIGKDYKMVHPQDIIIVKGTPGNVPVCAGIITNSYQTPLSHINILCHSRNIPSAVEQNIWKDPRVAALNGKPVRLTITGDSLRIEPAIAEEVAASMKAKTIEKTVKLLSDLTVQRLLDVKEFGLNDADVIGNKAAGVGEIYKVAKRARSHFLIPEGAFAIPFSYYQMHIANPAIKAEIDQLLDHSELYADNDKIGQQLKRIRKAIKTQPVDAALLIAVTKKIRAANAGRSYRFRSSSNAEDRIGFSGAGLYDSKTGILDDTGKSIERAIKVVWASAWNDEPFAERAFYNIDHRSAMMGILCHRSFPDERANGVAITRNLYRRGFPGFTVNVQKDEVSVVSPPDSVTCEQFVCMNAGIIDPNNDDVTVDYLTYSNINGGKPVLTRKEISRLYDALQDIKTHFYFRPQRGQYEEELVDYGLDIEFKFDRNGELYIKQARPYR